MKIQLERSNSNSNKKPPLHSLNSNVKILTKRVGRRLVYKKKDKND